MSQKKCPKCGENNPAEAVMCWACYTPLSGGATAAATPHATAPASVRQGASEGTTKKAVAPWQIGIIGVALLAAAVVGGSALMGGSSISSAADTTYTQPAPPPDVSPGGKPITTYNEGSAGAPGVAAVVPAQPAQPGQTLFTVSVPPKDGVPWGTMAIVPSGAISDQNAASIAAAACQRAIRGGKWDGLYVYVFSDAASAQKFREYQRGRDGQPFKGNDYDALQDLWAQVPVRYEYSRGFEAIRYPSKSPGSWWNGGSNWRRAGI